MADLQETCRLLMTRGKCRGKPVAVSLFYESIPGGYEPVQDTPCAIVHHAMDSGRRVYFDAEHHDCLVGVHHAGITPGSKEIVSGAYLSESSSFFTYEGAARLKSGTPVLPTGMVRAIGAAPLDDVPEGVQVDWIVVVCNPHHANFIAGCRLVHEGIGADGSFGVSLCGDLFAAPWHSKNVIVTFGDVGGRMHNKIKQDQVFVIIPIDFIDYLPATLLDVKVDVKRSRQMTKPPHSPFWHKKKVSDDTNVLPAEEPETSTDEITVTMPWSDEARDLLKKVPEGIVEMVVGNAEDYAREQGYEQVTRKSMDEQMAKMGTSIDEMLESM